MISSLVPIQVSTGLESSRNKAASTTAAARESTRDTARDRFISLTFLAPYCWATRMEKPCVSPEHTPRLIQLTSRKSQGPQGRSHPPPGPPQPYPQACRPAEKYCPSSAEGQRKKSAGRKGRCHILFFSICNHVYTSFRRVNNPYAIIIDSGIKHNRVHPEIHFGTP